MYLTSDKSRYSPIKVGGMRIFVTQDEALEHCALVVIEGQRERLTINPDWEWIKDIANFISFACPKVHEVFPDKPSRTIKVKVWHPLVLAKVKELRGK